MNAVFQIAMVIGSVGVLLGLMVLVRRQATAWHFSPEVERKLVHIGTGLYALTLPWLFPDRWPVYVLLAVTIIVLLVLRLGRVRTGLGRTLHGVQRHSYGDLLLTLAVGIVFLLSDGSAILYVLPLAILTLSDAAAALTGSHYGRRFFSVEAGHKSIEGSAAFFVTSFCLAMISLLVLSDVPRINVICLAAIVAAFGTLVEADSWRGFDNFFLPAGLIVFLDRHLASDPEELFGILALFLVAIGVGLKLAGRLGLSAHTMRVYIVAAFLLMTATALGNTVLPLLIFVAQAISHRMNACRAAYPELDMIAAVALVSFGWLGLGQAGGTGNIALYGMTALGMCLAFVSLGVAGRGVWTGASVRLLAAMVLGAAYLGLARPGAAFNAMQVGLAELALAMLLSVVVTAVWPQRFGDHRAAKIAGLALIVPLDSFAWQFNDMAGAL